MIEKKKDATLCRFFIQKFGGKERDYLRLALSRVPHASLFLYLIDLKSLVEKRRLHKDREPLATVKRSWSSLGVFGGE